MFPESKHDGTLLIHVNAWFGGVRYTACFQGASMLVRYIAKECKHPCLSLSR